ALPPSPGYNRSLGINSPLVEWVPPEARTCAEGPSMFHRGRCTAQCLPGYEPDIPFLSCNLGNFSPPVYQCVGQPCQALQGIPDAPAATCEEGTVLEHGGSCTTKCDYGFVPSDAVLSCNATVLDPANYTCIGTACNAPAGVANAPTMPCLEPPENLTHGSICTTQCLSGFVPSTPVLHCYGGQLRPASFECIEESVWLGYEPSDDTIAQAWAENVAADPAQQITDELSLAIHCVVLLASVATRQGQWSTLTGPQVEEFVLEPLTLDKAVACYRIAGGSTMCRALELVSESLVQGAEVLLSAAETYHISLASLADGAAVCFQQGLDTWRCRLLDVGSSSSLSMPEPRPAERALCGSLVTRVETVRLSQGGPSCSCLELSQSSLGAPLLERERARERERGREGP
ncbi:MIR1, partial [Symbiodinium necroappetens]